LRVNATALPDEYSSVFFHRHFCKPHQCRKLLIPTKKFLTETRNLQKRNATEGKAATFETRGKLPNENFGKKLEICISGSLVQVNISLAAPFILPDP
jgi:hypothetical protein